jgi:tRNA threonylcarbamoyladenosine biosynthesis protein TsaB
MSVLAIDTSTERAVLALAGVDGRMWFATTDASRRHGRDLVPGIRDLLGSAGLTAGDLEAIAVGLGPGSYTGLRVGVTAAKTLAYVAGAALLGLDSLHAIGRSAPADARQVSVIADAQRGDVYVADLARSGPSARWVPAAATQIEPLASWLARLEGGTVVLGPALASRRIRSAIPEEFLPAGDEAGAPSGEALIAMARESLAAGRREDPWLLEPRYLRRSAAEDLWESRVPSPRG